MLIHSVTPTDGSRVLAAAKIATRSAKSSGDLYYGLFCGLNPGFYPLYFNAHIGTGYDHHRNHHHYYQHDPWCWQNEWRCCPSAVSREGLLTGGGGFYTACPDVTCAWVHNDKKKTKNEALAHALAVPPVTHTHTQPLGCWLGGEGGNVSLRSKPQIS